MAAIGKVSLRGIVDDDSQYTFLVATGSPAIAHADITSAGVSAVTLSTTVANTVDLAGDGETILGQLVVVEVRTVEGITVGTVAQEGSAVFLVNPDVSVSSPDDRPTLGCYLVGATSDAGKKGYVRKASAQELALGTNAEWQVVELLTAPARVVAISV